MATALTDAGSAPGAHSRSAKRWVIAAVAVLAAALAATAIAFALRAEPKGSVVPTVNPTVEATWGIRPVQVATTADGGLVDFRFVALDPDKALALMQDVNNLPVLRVESNGKTVNSAAAMSANHDLAAGRTYFLLYRNAGGAIQRGTRLTIVFHDGSKIEHVVAR